ncbi:hypothetical protein [Brevundimonas sp. UBA7664]|uniref:hypothetical protein n=1 Tax=Brevundimonas sp. UBA7664 TaxID=1946141 RepID=UPI0025BF66AA|nr:hypothetical protein [Brevundimonas sp. UBA7664]
MMMTLIFRPDGVEPDRADFRMVTVPGSLPKEALHFQTMDQVVRHLKNNATPNGQKPWVQFGDTIIDPGAIEKLLAATDPDKS